MQPQGHVQIVSRILDHQQNPQAASDAPRWQVTGGRGVLLEHRFDPAVADALLALGHEVTFSHPAEFGGGQFIYRLPDGYLGASDHRKDGQPVGY